MAIRNMAHQHREFQSRLDDTEKLHLYAQSAASHHPNLNASLAKVKYLVEHWEKEAKEGAVTGRNAVCKMYAYVRKCTRRPK